MEERQLELLKKHLIPALDVEDMASAVALADHLVDKVAMVKIGSKLFTRYGPALLDEMADRGLGVFLDLKFHDIPNTVRGAAQMASAHPSVRMMTIHAAGGTRMATAALEGAADAQGQRPMIVAVTVLTSISPAETNLLGIDMGLDAWAEKLGRLALDAGVDGLVCSAEEAEMMRDLFGDECILVTPGIRPPGYAKQDDQARVTTPKDALAAGSSYLVMGRPIYGAPDPTEAIETIGSSL